MRHQLYTLMKEDITLVAAANCALARLWRLMLFDLAVRPSAWDNMMVNYIAESKKHIGLKAATNMKGNLPKALAKDEITFKGFCRGMTVFRFHRVVFSITATKDGETKTVSIDIPDTYHDDGGRYLKVLWLKLTKAFPYCTENWTEYMKKYREVYKKAHGVTSDSITSNLPRSLDEEQLTWNTMYQGIMVHDFDEITLTLDVYKRTSKKTANSIQLVVKKA